MIWTDKARGSVVVGCSRCPGVRELVNTDAEAIAWALAHMAMHERDDETRRAITAARARERRNDTPRR